MIQPVSLADVLTYRHSGVVRRYAKDHDVSLEDAAEVFQETCKWLYLCYRNATDLPEGTVCTMTPDIEKLDEMWHTFLLFTRDYADFCDRYFGFFLHHVPNEDAETRPFDEGAMRQQLEQQYALVYDVLGEGTLMAWHDECRYAVSV
ncbi:MAG: hypothetical protein K2R98_22850 [Gemmataceae bacterium]|nr:hypothetical protein [Gemmataceae bacterium]